MPAVNSELIDIRRFIAEQRAERFRAFIVHGAPLSGKSRFMREVAKREDGVYMDVLSLIHDDIALSQRVDTLDAAWLEGRVRAAIDEGATFVVVDDFDFLWPIWCDDIAPLLHRIERFYTPSPAVVTWVMPSHRVLDSAVITRATGASRVLRLNEIAAL